MACPVAAVRGEEGCVFGRVMSLSDMVLGFFEDGEGSPESYRDADPDAGSGSGSDEEGGENPGGTAKERKAFWESQHQLLQALLSRNSSLESRIRRDTEAALRQLRVAAGAACSCSRNNAASECRSCGRREISDRLLAAGYDSSLCKSKWRSSQDIPSGEHTYIDVMDTSSGKKGPVRVVVELNFRAEFEMARASGDYNSLVSRLPEVFVGRPEKLKGVIKVVCAAAKRCMKDNRMHMAPWRKHKYMQAKWLGAACERVRRSGTTPFPAAGGGGGFSDRQPKPRASMLTFDLLEKLPGLHRTAVEVVYVTRKGNALLV